MAQALFNALIVIAEVMIFNGRLWLALVLGGIAVATAPAPIMVMIKKLKSKGDLADAVIPIVGLDDMVGMIIFAILSSVGIGLVDGGSIPLGESFITAIEEVVLSIGIGVGADSYSDSSAAISFSVSTRMTGMSRTSRFRFLS